MPVAGRRSGPEGPPPMRRPLRPSSATGDSGNSGNGFKLRREDFLREYRSVSSRFASIFHVGQRARACPVLAGMHFGARRRADLPLACRIPSVAVAALGQFQPHCRDRPSGVRA